MIEITHHAGIVFFFLHFFVSFSPVLCIKDLVFYFLCNCIMFPLKGLNYFIPLFLHIFSSYLFIDLLLLFTIYI